MYKKQMYKKKSAVPRKLADIFRLFFLFIAHFSTFFHFVFALETASCVGFTTHCPSIYATRTAPAELAAARERRRAVAAALMLVGVGSCSPSAASKVKRTYFI